MKKNLRAVGLALIFLSFVNCSKDIKVGLKDFGTESSPDDVNNALDKVSVDASIANAQPGQVVHYEDNYTVDLNAVNIVSDTVRTFKSRVDDATSARFIMQEDFYSYDENRNIKDEKHSEVVYEMKKAIEEATGAGVLPSSVKTPVLGVMSTKKNEVCGKVTQDSEGNKFDCVQYFNFREVAVDDAVPARARARANCGNIPGCKIPTVKIYFDRVKLLDGKFVQKEIFEISSSSTVPYLFPELGIPVNYFCIAKLYHSETASYFVNRCTVLRDLKL